MREGPKAESAHSCAKNIFFHRFGIPARYRNQRCETAADADPNSDSEWEDGAIDRATGTQFRERSFHPINDRRKTSGGHSAEPALRRIRFRRPAHHRRFGFAEYRNAASNVDAADRQGGPGLHFHRELGFGPTGFNPEYLLLADNASWGSEKEEAEVLVLVMGSYLNASTSWQMLSHATLRQSLSWEHY